MLALELASPSFAAGSERTLQGLFALCKVANQSVFAGVGVRAVPQLVDGPFPVLRTQRAGQKPRRSAAVAAAALGGWRRGGRSRRILLGHAQQLPIQRVRSRSIGCCAPLPLPPLPPLPAHVHPGNLRLF